MHLTNIKLKNFKSHKNSEFNPKLVTIFIGPNSSGKSSVLQSLLVLKESFNTRGNQIPPVTKTISFDLGDYDDVVSNNIATKNFSIKIGGEKILPHGLRVESSTRSNFSYEVEFSKNGVSTVHFFCNIDDVEIDFRHTVDEDFKVDLYDKKEHLDYNFTNVSLNGLHPRMSMTSEGFGIEANFFDLFGNGKYTERLMDEFYYVPFNRTATNYAATLTISKDELLSTNLIHT